MSSNGKMHSGIQVRRDFERGCGWRKEGGIYLVSDGDSRGCGRFPTPLEVCPCCGAGFKPSRTPQWIDDPGRILFQYPCQGDCDPTCPFSAERTLDPAILLWIGEKFYKTPQDFLRESGVQGISRRIQHVPKDFKVGKTWVLLAHRKSIDVGGVFDDNPSWTPGIFAMFRPTRIEIVVTGNEDEKTIESYLERGLTPVVIEHNQPDSESIQASTDPLF